jgi:hypothetical protein
MSRFKLLAVLAGTALTLAVVTALAGVTPKGVAAPGPLLAKGDRVDTRDVGAGAGCLHEPWPYGCQWQAATPVLVRPHAVPRSESGQRSRPREPLSAWKRRMTASGKRPA